MGYIKGCTDRAMVKSIQEALKITVDGVFGPATEKAVVNYQLTHNLKADGIVGRNTLESMGILDTDLKSQAIFKTPNNLVVNRHFLPKGEFIEEAEPILNDYFILHHTAGWDNPFATIDCWARDDRGRIATEFVIGGQNFRTGSDEFDGIVAQSFPIGCQGWHIGTSGSSYMNRHSAAVEICNFGYLTNENRNYVGIVAHESQVITLSEAFKGYTKWHRYSDAQIESLRKLIIYVGNRDNIDIRKGLVEWIKTEGPTKAFDYQQDAYDGKVKGLLLHSNIRKDKVDLFPQQEVVDMLLSL